MAQFRTFEEIEREREESFSRVTIRPPAPEVPPGWSRGRSSAQIIRVTWPESSTYSKVNHEATTIRPPA